MPDDANNIYVDATFSTTADSSEDVDTELSLAEADVIGAYNMPVVYTASGYDATTFESIDTEYAVGSGIDLGFDVDIEYFNTGTVTISGTYVGLVLYNSGSTVASGERSEYVECFLAGDTMISGLLPYNPRTTDMIVDYGFPLATNNVVVNIVDYWTWVPSSGIKEFPTEYYRPPPIDSFKSNTADITFGSTTMYSGSGEADVDVTFAGWVDYPWLFDLYCAVSGTNYIDSELTVISGAVDSCLIDIVCGTLGTPNVDIDAYCCLIDYAITNYELTVISGSADKLDYDVYCSAQVTDNLSFDVDLLSLKISNFLPVEEDYSFVSTGVSVDITDDVYAVLTSASGIPCSGTCCLTVDGTAVPVTFSGITDGYRMYYNPVDNFGSLEGSTEFLVHAENSNGDILERSYYLTYGYLVEYDNIERVGFDYGIDTQVLVRMSAENLATCPKYSADAYWFETRDYSQKDLGASIIGEPPAIILEAEANLGASIDPQSTAFFYGKTFRVVLNAKDFAGNEMEPYEFEFKIEDAPE